MDFGWLPNNSVRSCRKLGVLMGNGNAFPPVLHCCITGCFLGLQIAAQKKVSEVEKMHGCTPVHRSRLSTDSVSPLHHLLDAWEMGRTACLYCGTVQN